MIDFDSVEAERVKLNLETHGAKVSIVAKIDDDGIKYELIAKWPTGREWSIERIDADKQDHTKDGLNQIQAT